MVKIIQITDTHIVPPGQGLWGFDSRARLEACIADINARHGNAEACIITGDLTDSGAPAAYEVLRDVLADLRLPTHLLIGNHDDRSAFLATFPDTPLDPLGYVQQTVESEAGVFLLLDSNETGLAAGVYGEDRCAWLEAELDRAGDRPIYLFIHHPPFDIHIPKMDRIRLLEPGPLAAAVAGRPNLRHLFFGHVHRPMSGSWNGIPFSALPSLVHQVDPDPDATTPIFTADEPHYAVIHLETDRTLVDFRTFLKPQPLSANSQRTHDLAAVRY